jgi:hypothetical protein
VYHFHDTSDTSPAKQTMAVDDNRFFRPDAANLAAYLYRRSGWKPLLNVRNSILSLLPWHGHTPRSGWKPLLLWRRHTSLISWIC